MINDFMPRRTETGSASSSSETNQPEPQTDSETPATQASAIPKPAANKRRFNLPGLKRWKKLNSRQRLLSLIVCGILLIAGTVGAMQLFIKDPPAPTPVKITPKAEPPKPTTVPSPLTGVQITPELAALPVTGVLIENSPDARPQAGLSSAGVVFEAIAEGGITRFLALYQEDQPDHIGPVRSARPYFLDFLVPFDAALAHAGGSAEALAQIRDQKIKDIDHGVNGGTFQRVSNRFAPHNLYTSRAQLLEAHNRRGYTSSTFTGWPRKEKETPLETPTATNISFNLSGQLYNSTYTYNKESNSYMRNMAGRPHTDERSGEQISPKVVIAIVTSRVQSGIYSVYQVTGNGSVLVFQDGGVIEGTWEKTGRSNQYVFKTPDGKPLALNPGRTWVTLATPGSVTHTP